MAEKLTIDFATPLPLFPLSKCVLLPHATVPLHIYESRYRQMTRDVLDSHGLITMALYDGQPNKPTDLGGPTLRPHVCVGYVVRHECLRDGRYNLLLQGICRARILKEIPHKPYRTALLEPAETSSPMEIDLTEQRQRIERLLSKPLLKQLASISAIHNWLSAEIPTTALIDLAIITVCQNTQQRYAMLAEPDTFVRSAWLEKLLDETLQTLTTAQRFQQETPADGIFLN